MNRATHVLVRWATALPAAMALLTADPGSSRAQPALPALTPADLRIIEDRIAPCRPEGVALPPGVVLKVELVVDASGRVQAVRPPRRGGLIDPRARPAYEDLRAALFDPRCNPLPLERRAIVALNRTVLMLSARGTLRMTARDAPGSTASRAAVGAAPA